MSVNITIDGVVYPYPSGAADTNWAANQVAVMQAIAASLLGVVEPVWVAPSLINSWSNRVGQAPAGYYKNPVTGDVRTRFALEAGSNGTVAFVLPAGSRPPYETHLTGFIESTPDGVLDVKIATNGEVTLSSLTAGVTPDAGTYFEGTFSTVANP